MIDNQSRHKRANIFWQSLLGILAEIGFTFIIFVAGLLLIILTLGILKWFPIRT
jgi:hypothetical protein